MKTVSQDKNARLNYWLDFSDILGSRTIDSAQIDPDGDLSGLTVQSMGVNDSAVTDNDGNTIPTGQAFGVTISGGTIYEHYRIVIRLTLDSGEIDDRTVEVRITDK